MPRDVFGRDYGFLPRAQLLRYDEIETLVRAFIMLGVCKVRLTGGEPLLRNDLEELIARLARLQLDELAITTNASLLTKSRAASLKAAGIRRVNISLDALDEKVYRAINRINQPLDNVLRGIEHALNADFAAVKINMVVQKDINVGEIIPMAKRFRGSGAILRFIEFMDAGNHNHWSLDRVFDARAIVELIHRHFPLEPLAPNYRGEVARRWRYADGAGEIGVIASISQPFCGGCMRARLSAAGELFTCLFADSGADLRAAVRGGMNATELSARIAELWQRRRDQYSVERLQNQPRQVEVGAPIRGAQKVEMSYIGG